MKGGRIKIKFHATDSLIIWAVSAGAGGVFGKESKKKEKSGVG